MHFGEKIRLLRTAQAWSQPEVAARLGIEQSYLSKLENGHSLPSDEVLRLILQLYRITLADLLQDLDDPGNKRQLATIPLVANYLSQQNTRKLSSRKRLLYGAALACSVGITVVILGYILGAYPTRYYQYTSDSIVPKGNAGEIFTTLDAYIDYAVAPAKVELISTGSTWVDFDERAIQENHRVKYQLANLLTQEFMSTSAFRGDLFSIDASNPLDQQALAAAGIQTGGSRTYQLTGESQLTSLWFRWLYALGGFFLSLGIFGFVLERRLFREI